MPLPARAAMFQQQVDELHAMHLDRGGELVHSYYPPSMEAEAHRFGLAFTDVDGQLFSAGHSEYAFPLHSMSKVFIYAVALEDNGRESTLERVGVEPSGDPFNSISFDERHNRPHNAMINAGALVATHLVHGADADERVERVVERLRVYAGNPDLQVDEEILADELQSNDRNLALSYLMRSLGMLSGDLYENIRVYLSLCSVRVNCRELATMGATLANGGVNPVTGERALARARVRDVLTVMAMCGMYDAAGEWAYDVGIPAKSGVSGGILLAMPDRLGGGLFSPGLDIHGNSVRGVDVCRDLSERFGLHMLANPDESVLGRSEPTLALPGLGDPSSRTRTPWRDPGA